MRNDKVLLFEDITIEQTELLLDSIDTLPLSNSVARRIRERVLENGKQRSNRRKHKQVGRVLIPIAACLIAIVVLFIANPKAAHAVSAFFGRVFTPSRYMNEDPAERTPVPSIDEAIAAAAPKDGDYRVSFITKESNAEQIRNYRTLTGSSFNEADWRWLSDIRPEIAEVLYDGNQLIWNTNLYTDNLHIREFMECYGMESGSKFAVDALVEGCTYTVEGDPTVYQMYSSGGGITPIYTEQALAEADHVVLYTDFMLDQEHPLPSGVLTITQQIVLFVVDGDVGQSAVGYIYHTFTFDTTKGNQPAANNVETIIPLSGEVYLSINHRETAPDGTLTNWVLSTERVSLNDVKLKAKFEYLPTGITLFLSVAEKPAGWTDDMTAGLLMQIDRDINGRYRTPGLAIDLYIDGVLANDSSMPGSYSKGELTCILPVFPDQYAALKSVVLKLSLYHYITLCGTNQLNGETLYLPPNNNVDLASDVDGGPLIEIPVPLP